MSTTSTSLQSVLSKLHFMENNVQNILKDLKNIIKVIEQELRVDGEQKVAERITDLVARTEVETIDYKPTALCPPPWHRIRRTRSSIDHHLV
jgi:Asp-tRNA(Asn)/Glu-tRNA(Gln) amidotransferase C subunit